MRWKGEEEEGEGEGEVHRGLGEWRVGSAVLECDVVVGGLWGGRGGVLRRAGYCERWANGGKLVR